MIAVIFEVEPTVPGYDQYLEHAARLKPLLEQGDGFISVERFRSLANPNKLRVADVARDYGLYEREQAPPFHPPIAHPAAVCPVLPPQDW